MTPTRDAHRREPVLAGAGTAPLLFVYGTLMRGYPLHATMGRAVTFLGSGTVRGRLLDLGRYPGIIEGRGRVRGEVYRLDDPEVLSALDREEGYNFVRRRAAVMLEDGRRIHAWIYRYRGSQDRAIPIADGDYRRARPVVDTPVPRRLR